MQFGQFMFATTHIDVECTVKQGNNHVVILVAMPPGVVAAFCEAPFRCFHPIILDQDRRGRRSLRSAHNLNLSFWGCVVAITPAASESDRISTVLNAHKHGSKANSRARYL